MRVLDDTGAGRSGGGIEPTAGIWPLVRDHVFEQGVEFCDRSGQFRHDLLTLFGVDCVARLGAQFFDVLFPRVAP